MGELNVEKHIDRINQIKEERGIGAAVRLAREAVAAYPEVPRLLATLAHHLLWCGEPEEALELAARALEKDSKCWEAACVLADHAALGRDPERSMRFFRIAVDISPDSRLTLLAGLNAYTICSNREASLSYSRRLVDLYGHLPSSWSALYYTLHACMLADEAERLLTKPPQSFEATGEFQLALARSLMKKQEFQESEVAAKKAVELLPESNSAWAALAQVLSLQGKSRDTRQAAEKSLSINRRDSVALSALERIADADDERAVA